MSTAARGGTPRWVGLSGLVFIGLLIAAIPIGTAPEADASDATILDYYTDSGNQAKQLIAAVILTAAIVALLIFVVGVRSVLVEAGAPWPFPELALVGGLAAAIIALAGYAVGTAVPATFAFSDTFQLEPNTARVILTAGNIWLVTFAGGVGSLLVGAVSLASRRTSLLPAWLEWTGLVLAPSMLVAVPFFGLSAIALALWILGVSIVLLIRSRRVPSPTSS